MNKTMNEPEGRAGMKAALAQFEKTTDFFFRGGGRGEALRMLGHLLRYSDLQLVLVGAEGAGKTHLFNAFAANDQRGLRCYQVRAIEFMGIGAMSEALQRAAGSSLALAGSVEQRLQALKDLSRKNGEDGVLGVVLVDDAHLLSADALEFLIDAELAVRSEAGLRFVLAGDESLREHLRHSRLVERLEGKCHFLELEPLSREVAMDYLEQRLASTGLTADLFSAKEADYILQQGNGLPGRLGDAVLRVLRSGVPTGGSERLRMPRQLPSWHWWALATVGLLIVLALFLEPDAGGPEDKASEPAAVVRKVEVPVIVAARREAVPLLAGPKSQVPVSSDEAKQVDVPSPSQASPSPAPELAVTNREAPTTAVTDDEAAAGEDTDLAAAPLPAAAAPAADPETPALDVQREAFLAAREQPATAVKGERWLLEQAPGSYTVQLLGTYSQESAESFIARQQDPARFTIFRTSLSGKPWFVVILGSYPDRERAVRAIELLPASLRRQNPWARSLASIQKAILDGRSD